MILADCRAWLDRIRGDAIIVELERYHVPGFGEGGVGGLFVAHHQRERDVIRLLVPYRRRAWLRRVFDADDSRQQLVLDFNEFGGVSRLRIGFRHHEGDAITDRAHLRAFEDSAQRAESLGAAHVLRHRRRQTAELVGERIRSGEHREHARRGLRFRRIDALDAGVRVRRHHHDTVALLRQFEIINITATAGDEARIFDPRHRLTDTEFVHAELLIAIIHPAQRGGGPCEAWWRGRGKKGVLSSAPAPLPPHFVIAGALRRRSLKDGGTAAYTPFPAFAGKEEIYTHQFRQ